MHNSLSISVWVSVRSHQIASNSKLLSARRLCSAVIINKKSCNSLAPMSPPTSSCQWVMCIHCFSYSRHFYLLGMSCHAGWHLFPQTSTWLFLCSDDWHTSKCQLTHQVLSLTSWWIQKYTLKCWISLRALKQGAIVIPTDIEPF